MARLTVFFDRKKVAHYDVEDGRVRIGRHPKVDIFLPHKAVSRLHAIVLKVDEGWAVQTAGSSNVVFVNGSAVKGARLLEEKDRIQFAKYVIQFSEQADDEEAIAEGEAVSASASAPRPSGDEEYEPTVGLTPEKLLELRRRTAQLARPHIVWKLDGDEKMVNLKDQGAFIGTSSDSQIRIPSGWLVASQHARVVKMVHSFVIAPCEWWGKVRVNGEKVGHPRSLEDGDEILIGKTKLTFRMSAFQPG